MQIGQHFFIKRLRLGDEAPWKTNKQADTSWKVLDSLIEALTLRFLKCEVFNLIS